MFTVGDTAQVHMILQFFHTQINIGLSIVFIVAIIHSLMFVILLGIDGTNTLSLR